MEKLFIIGNGFDIAHDMKTTYKDFRNWFNNKLVKSSNEELTFEDLVSPDINRKNWSDDDIEYKVILGLLDDACNSIEKDTRNYEWNNLECNLANVDFSSWLNIEDDNIKSIENKTNREKNNILLSINFTLMSIDDLKNVYLKEWIDSIEIPKCKIAISDIIDKETYFLTFNYTNTLEEIYQDEIDKNKINHIHINNDKYIFGTKFQKKDVKENQKYINKWYRKSYEKPVNQIIESNNLFFKNLSKCNCVYSFGFSYSDIDMPYIEKIIKSIDSNTITWNFNNYDFQNNLERYKEKINNVSQNKHIEFQEYDC